MANHFQSILDKQDSCTRSIFNLLLLKTRHANVNAQRSLPKKGMRKVLEVLKDPDGISKLSAAAAARVLTKYEFALFQNICPTEFLNQNWQSVAKETEAPNITKFVSRFNQIAYWVASEIITTRKPKTQVKKLEKFVEIAMCCNQKNNFNAMMEIVSGLNNAAIQRLDYLWKSISERCRQNFEKLDALMSPDHNFASYREELKARQYPILPYFALYLRDITFANTAHSPYLNGEFNVEWMNLFNSLVKEIRSYQSKGFENLKGDDSDFVAEHLLLSQDLVALDDEVLYKLSLKLAPANRVSMSLPVQPTS
jgi:hypothetical protein